MEVTDGDFNLIINGTNDGGTESTVEIGKMGQMVRGQCDKEGPKMCQDEIDVSEKRNLPYIRDSMGVSIEEVKGDQRSFPTKVFPEETEERLYRTIKEIVKDYKI